jgi:chaperonin GroEL
MLMNVPGVLFGAACREPMLRGFETLGRLLALTLGPLGGNIVHQRVNTTEAETLSDAATIARRFIELPDRVQNVGAMIMRQIVWAMREKYGDGSATAAVLAQRVGREAHRLIAAGADPMALRRGIEKGARAAMAALDEQSQPLEKAEQIAGLATAAIAEPEIGRLLGEMYEVLGPYGTIVIQPYLGLQHDRAYHEGTRFPGEYVSPYLVSDAVRRVAAMDDPYVLVADMHFETVDSVLTVVDLVARAGGQNLFIICKNMWEKAIGTLVYTNNQNGVKAYAATIKPVEDLRPDMMRDVALLTGATHVSDTSGIGLKDLTIADLGRAERIVATRDYVMITGGRGDKQALRERARRLREQLRTTVDPEQKQRLRERIGRLTGGVGELRVAAITEQERVALTEKAAHATKVVQVGMEGGIVPGGGAAYLAAIPAVEAVPAEGDERFGLQVVARALEEPLRVIASNAHAAASVVLAECRARGAGYGYEARQGRVANMLEEQIVDATIVAKEALNRAVSGAVMLITSETLVLHRKPPKSMNP